MQINSNNVIGDDLWLWRADHGSGVGWTTNTAQNGLVVNGANVTMYGLFVEHYQQYQVLWNGNGGRTYFFQNEMPYDVPNQSSWMNGSTRGLRRLQGGELGHQPRGVGRWAATATSAPTRRWSPTTSFEVPQAAGVKFHDMVTVSLGGTGTISHIINNTGGPSNSGDQRVESGVLP